MPTYDDADYDKIDGPSDTTSSSDAPKGKSFLRKYLIVLIGIAAVLFVLVANWLTGVASNTSYMSAYNTCLGDYPGDFPRCTHAGDEALSSGIGGITILMITLIIVWLGFNLAHSKVPAHVKTKHWIVYGRLVWWLMTVFVTVMFAIWVFTWVGSMT